MHTIFLVPQWFIGYDIILEALFGVITLLVALKAFQVHSMSSQHQVKLFGIGFLFVSISYFLQAIINIFIITEINESMDRAVDLLTIGDINGIGLWLHATFFMLALVTLAYMTLDIKSAKAYVLLAIIVGAALVLSVDLLLALYLFSIVLLAFIATHYIINFFRRKRLQTFIVLLAFLLLLVGSIHFAFSVSNAKDYVIGHLLGFFAYVLIIINLMMVGAHDKKKGPTSDNS
jgi:hypothetical protein